MADLRDHFMTKGRLTKDEKKDEYKIVKTFLLKKLRAQKKGQRHLLYIKENRSYSEEENLRLCDLF